MQLLSRQELEALSRKRAGPCISIFMPTHRQGREIQQDPIRFKNLLGEAEERLIELGMRPATARETLGPANYLLEDTLFWRNQSDGLAAFISPDFFRLYRLPLTFDELLVVTDRFHVKPLLPLLTEDGRYFVLALSQNEVRLLECTRFRASEVDLQGTPVPTSIAEALRYDDPEKQLQFRSGDAGAAAPGGGRGPAIFHGHGIVDRTKDELRRYFDLVDHGLREVIGEGGPPLVLAGVDYLLPIYAEANQYGNLVEGGITGSPDGLSTDDLREQAWSAVGPIFQSAREEATARYRQLMGTGLASNRVDEVVPAAWYGRVDTLFVKLGEQVWGTFDEEKAAVEVRQESRAGDEDLLDLAATRTLLNSGTVFATSEEGLPDSQPLSAIFRY